MFSFPKCFLSSSIHFYFILTISLRYNRHTVFKVYSLIGSDMKLIWQPMCWPYLSPPKLPCAPLWLLPPCHPLPQTTTYTFVSRLYRLLFHFLELYTSEIINMYFCGGKVDVHSAQLGWDSFLLLFQWFIPFYCCMAFHVQINQNLVIHIPTHGHLCCFQFGDIPNTADMSTDVQILGGTYTFFSSWVNA